jgi:beta-hydroxylase
VFYDAASFPFVPVLERASEEIYQEYLQIEAELEDWVEHELFDNSWQVYRLFEFPGGEPLEAHCRACPKTAEIVRSCFPRHGAAGFSVLRPHTNIFPHEGYHGTFLRCHLGLAVPEGDCALKVAGEERRWKNGQVLIFDDRVTHSAWNHTEQSRVVLLADFVPRK